MKRARSYYQSSSFKMAVLFTALLGLSSVLLSYLLYDLNKQNFIRETEAAIDSEIEHIVFVTSNSNNSDIITYINQRILTQQHSFYLYQDNQHKWKAGNIAALPYDITRLKEGVIRFNIDYGKREYILAAKIHTLHDGSTLVVARNINHIIKSYQRIKHLSIMIMGFMLMVVLISFFLSTFVVTRINKIADTAKAIINTGDLSRRITVDSNWDDLSYLSKTLNELLERIEQLMQGIRDVSDNIAHDLRTPITRLRGRLENLSNKKLTTKDIQTLVNEADHILAIFNSLLRIGKIEKGKHLESFCMVAPHTIIDDVVELYEPLATQKEIAIHCNLSATHEFPGDRDLLFQMLANLIDNAIKFSNNKSTITINTKDDDKSFHIEVIDEGPGIESQDIEKVFHRFYRADKSRNTEGSGLGLSMVKAIAELHQADITLHNHNPGLMVRITFFNDISNIS